MIWGSQIRFFSYARLKVGLILLVEVLTERNGKNSWVENYLDAQLFQFFFFEFNKIDIKIIKVPCTLVVYVINL